MRKETCYCDFCNVKLKSQLEFSIISFEIITDINETGMCEEIISKRTYELCSKCFSKVEVKSKELRDLILDLMIPEF